MCHSFSFSFYHTHKEILFRRNMYRNNDIENKKLICSDVEKKLPKILS